MPVSLHCVVSQTLAVQLCEQNVYAVKLYIIYKYCVPQRI